MFKTTLPICALLLFARLGFCAEPGVIAPNAERIAAVERGEATEALASWWGYDPADATDSLQAALNSGVKVLTVDSMSGPWIVRPLKVPSNLEIRLADHVEILAKQGEYLGQADSLLTVSLQKNVTVRGGEGSALRMRKSDYHAPPYKKAEWRHGLNIKSSENVTIENISICDTGGDGIYLGVAKAGVPCRNITIRRVVCDGNNRQGISVISADHLLIEDCALINTSGTAPAAGIDFEPNSYNEQLTDCVLRNCVINNNYGCGIALYLPNLDSRSTPLDLTIENCTTEGNRQWGFCHTVGSGPGKTLRGKMIVRNCLFKNDAGGIVIQGKGIDAHSMLFENIRVEDAACGGSSSALKERSPLSLVNRSADESPLGGIEFCGLTLIDPLARRPISYSDQSPLDLVPSEITGSVTTATAAGAADQKTFTLDKAYWESNWPPLNPRRIPTLALDKTKFRPLAENAETDKSPSLFRFRHQGNWWLYAKAGEKMTFSLQSFRVGVSDLQETVPTLLAPSGKEEKLAPLAPGQKTEYSVDAKESGVYLLTAAVGVHSAVLSKNNVPAAVPITRSAALIGTTGTFYFFVPKGTEAFGVKLIGNDVERVTATVLNPTGEKVWREENISTAVLFATPEGKPVESGVWTLRFEKPTQGVLEDFIVSILGVPPLMTNEKRSILAEK